MSTFNTIYTNSMSTFGGLKTTTTKKQGGFDSAGEKTIIIGNGKGSVRKKPSTVNHLSAAEEACDLLNQKFQR